VSSAIGGVVGYWLGAVRYGTVGLWIINTYGYQEVAARYRTSAHDVWFWLLITRGLTPIPFKIVTIISGLIDFNFGFSWPARCLRASRSSFCSRLPCAYMAMRSGPSSRGA
jgi:membrane protein YqaA with SNARE-associated domain